MLILWITCELIILTNRYPQLICFLWINQFIKSLTLVSISVFKPFLTVDTLKWIISGFSTMNFSRQIIHINFKSYPQFFMV